MALFNLKTKITVAANDKYIESIVIADVIKTFTSRSKKINESLKRVITPLITTALYSSPTVQSLLAGKLRDEFGLAEGIAQQVSMGILDYLSSNYEVSISRGFKPQIFVRFFPVNPLAMSIIPGSSFRSRGGNVDWLQWLLTRGSEVVVGDFWLFENAKGKTRSGGTDIMLPVKKYTQADPFRVDPEHAGTLEDNFITRALSPAYPKIIDAVVKEIIRNLS